jgi:light-regulated signal transduction histidine kinase (bacteriophytochrome)
MVKSVYHDLSAMDDPARISFQVEALPAACGDPKLLYQVWTNLISNAIKFSARREKALIQIGSQVSAAETIFYIRDNGAGFDPQYAEKLFGVFQRLHSERDFAGTGVGLAIVQRIISRHGGRVWAEGRLNEGATFYFSIPYRGS